MASKVISLSPQAMMCYTPKMLWDACEGDLLKTIVMGLNIGVCHAEEKDKKKDAIISYLIMYEKVSLTLLIVIIILVLNTDGPQSGFIFLPITLNQNLNKLTFREFFL